MSTEDIIKLIAFSKKRRNVAHVNAMQFEEEIADLEGKPALTDDERTCIILDHITGKLQMYNSEFHEYHYRLVDYSTDQMQGITHARFNCVRLQ